MTRIFLVFTAEFRMPYIVDDPRSPRELVKAINTGKLVVGKSEFSLPEGTRQWAMIQPPHPMITVVLDAPPVELTPRLYDVLYGLADGKDTLHIARELELTTRTVYAYIAELKNRFGARSRMQLIAQAVECGIVRD